MKKLRLEHAVLLVFCGLTLLFGVEVLHFLQEGAWVIHGGVGEFARWPQPQRENLLLWLHSLGMLAWIGVVMYQLQSRGRGAHTLVGRVGGLLVLLSLGFSVRPAVVSEVPALHALGGLTLMDITLVVNVVGIVVETVVGVLKARGRKMAEHRQHLMVAVMFTAAPGLYRAYVMALRWLLEPQGELETVWMHELSACLAILSGLVVLLSGTFSGHRAALAAAGRSGWQRGVAWGMTALSAALVLLYLVWVADLFALRASGLSAALFTRGDAPLWIAYL